MTGREAPVNADNFCRVQEYTVGTVLDVGAGRAHPHADVTVDIDRAVEPDVVADLTAGIPVVDDAVETVTAVHVVEHVPDDAGLWAEMQRVASERAICVVPIGPRDDPDHEHVYGGPDVIHERFGPDWTTTSSWGAMIDLVFGVDVCG